jgi:hypothetical protein
MQKDTLQPLTSAQYLMNLSPEDFILEKIRERLKDVTSLKESYFKLTGIDAEIALSGFTTPMNFPSKKELEANISKFLEEKHNRAFKTSDLIKKFHPDTTDKKNRLELTRRYSGVLASMKKDGNMFSKEIKGEKGDLYCADKDLLVIL